jgi:hypothetical protein
MNIGLTWIWGIAHVQIITITQWKREDSAIICKQSNLRLAKTKLRQSNFKTLSLRVSFLLLSMISCDKENILNDDGRILVNDNTCCCSESGLIINNFLILKFVMISQKKRS